MGLKWGGIFGILKISLKIFFFKKVHYFWVWRLFVGVYCGFVYCGEFDLFLGLGFDIGGFVFSFRLIFGLFLGLRGALKPWYCIVVQLLLSYTACEPVIGVA